MVHLGWSERNDKFTYIIGSTQINFGYYSDLKFMSEIFGMKIFFRKG